MGVPICRYVSIVSLSQMLLLDKSLEEVISLPKGYIAKRKGLCEWEIKKI